ncbi:MAG: hypothetical protein AABX89_02895 [Candidatus Thermoplasmatota archaeon]
MKLLAALVLLAILAAGCAQSGLSSTSPTDGPARPVLEFRPAVDLGSKVGVVAVGTSCTDSAVDRDCGLGEPGIEVDGVGTIYVTGVCCLTNSPPIYVSRDGGVTFTTLDTPTGVREAFGIEGDFAVDAVGRIYFADIEFAATFQMTVWEADGTFVRHTKWPAPPLVDRDWVRAEGDGIVYYYYNTGSATKVYKSMDAAQTFTPVSLYDAPYALGNAIGGVVDGTQCLAGGSVNGNTRVDCTTNGGLLWSNAASTVPSGPGLAAGSFDEGGNLYLASDANGIIQVARRAPDGGWLPSVNITSEGTSRLPWMAAGRDGVAAVAWYGTNASQPEQWFLRVALSRDGGARWQSVVADPEPVFTGALARDLLDFFQVEIGPDGALHIAYSKLRVGEGNEEQLTYVRSEPNPNLAFQDYRFGPA